MQTWVRKCLGNELEQFQCVPIIFLIGIMGGGVQFGSLGTAATNRPIVPAPGDYDDG
jgi:hypothetical protein